MSTTLRQGLDKKVKFAIKAYLEANGRFPIYEGEPQATPVMSRSSVRPSKLRVTYYGPRDKDTPDKTFVSFNLLHFPRTVSLMRPGA